MPTTKPASEVPNTDTTPPSSEIDELRESLQVKSPDQIVKWLNLMIYGEAGAGKTYMLGTAIDDPRLRPLLIFDIEGGMLTLRDKPGIDVISVRSREELEAKYNKLYHSIKDGKMYYKTMGVDSLPELADLDMRQVMKEAYNRNPDKVHIDVPGPREYGIVRNHIRLIVRAFKDLPCHVVFTAGLGIDQPENQPPKYFPTFSGKLAREVPGFVDIVGYYYTKNDMGVINRYLQVQGTNRVVAKDRTGVLGGTEGFVMNPTLSSIWDAIEGMPMVDNGKEVE